MSANFSTNIGDDYMQAMMEPERTPQEERPAIVDWSKPIEIHEKDGAVYQAVLVGFDGKDLAVVKKVNYGQYTAYRKCDGSLAGGPAHRYIRNKVGV